MPEIEVPRKVGNRPTLITFEPSGRGVAFEWLLPDVLRFVDAGIRRKGGSPVRGGTRLAGYDVAPGTLERVRRWLLKAQRSAEPVVEIPRRRAPRRRYGPGRYVSVADWFASGFVNDWLHRSIYCPRCRKSYPNGQEKFVLLGPCRSGTRGSSRTRAPTALTCPKGHLLKRE